MNVRTKPIRIRVFQKEKYIKLFDDDDNGAEFKTLEAIIGVVEVNILD